MLRHAIEKLLLDSLRAVQEDPTVRLETLPLQLPSGAIMEQVKVTSHTRFWWNGSDPTELTRYLQDQLEGSTTALQSGTS